MLTSYRCGLIAAALACLPGAVGAQWIDQFDIRREGNHAVLQLRFANEVQFQRSISMRSGDLTLVFYSLVRTTNDELRAPRSLRLGADQGLPELIVTDEAERGPRDRRMVIRSKEPLSLSVRAGRGNRSIEIVFAGLGAQVAAAAPAPRTPASAAAAAPAALIVPQGERRFVILLQSATDPSLLSLTPVPRALQAYEVVSGQRIVDGVRRYEVLLGYFSNRVQAEAALRLLTAFPQAAVAPYEPAASEPAQTARAVAAAPTAPLAPAAPVVPLPAIVGAAVPAAPSPASAPAAAPGPEAPIPTPAEVDAKANALYANAQAAMAAGRYADAIQAFNDLLNLPPNRRTRDAQESIGLARARSGDMARARAEFETYLQLYPQGPGSERVRRELAALPAPAAAEPAKSKPEVETLVSGSTAMYYYSGNGQVRSQDFKDSPVAGLPQVAGEPLLTADKTRQLYNDVDLGWRRRDGDSDMRFAFRDSYTRDLERPDKSRNRLSALYFDYKSIPGGFGARIGRQSPTGGGVLGRFDGVAASWLAQRRLKLGAVAGEPTDRFFDSRRRFFGVSLDADQLLPNFSAGIYAIQQNIDGEIDRRAVGLDMRYFQSGVSVFSQFDYDLIFKTLNIATIQGTVISADNTVFSALYDRRALQLLALGNSLTFADPANPSLIYTRIADKLATTTLEALRDQIKRITPFITQGQLGLTHPLNPTWQVGANLQLTSTGEIPPVPEVAGFETGRPASGNIYSAGLQLIGLNLYSKRDTHVFSVTGLHSPTMKGALASYNLSSVLATDWQLEPSLQYYRDRNTDASTNQRWTPGLRITYRGWQRWAIETGITYEIGQASRVSTSTDPVTGVTTTTTTQEKTNRANFSVGARLEF